MAIGANVSAVLGRWREGLGSHLAPLAGRGRREAPGEGALRESVCHRFRGSSPSPQPSPRKNGARGTRELPEPRATVSLCDAFPVGFKLRNELRTNRGRIADSPLSPVPFTQDVAGGLLGCTRWSFAPPHKRRFGGGFVKAGDGAESNQNRGGVKWIPRSRPPSKQKARKQPHAQ